MDNNKSSQSLAEELQRLADLHQQGALTEEEFRDAKRELLSPHSPHPHEAQTAPNNIEQPSSEGRKSTSKYFVVGIVALIALAIFAFLIFGRTSKTQTETIDLPQLVELFMIADGEQASWSMGAGETSQQIKWQSQGVEGKLRQGLARVTIENAELQDLRTRLEPIQWEIILSTSGLPKFGPETVEIAPKCDTVDCKFAIEKALLAYGFKLKKLCHAGPAPANVTAFFATYLKKNIYILFSEDVGSAGTSNRLELSWNKPNSDDEMCADAKKNESDFTPTPAEQLKPTESVLPNNQSSISAPTINVGDKYTYETELTDSNGKTTSSTSTREVAAIDGDRITVIATSGKSGKTRTLIYDRSWNIVETGDTPNSGMIYSPAIKYFDFPLIVGKKWSSTSTETDKKTGKTRQHIVNGEVVGWDNYLPGTYQGKKFEALKIRLETEVSDGEKKSTGTDISWYIPVIGRTSKSEIQSLDAEGRQERKITRITDIHLQNGWKQANLDTYAKNEKITSNNSGAEQVEYLSERIRIEAKKMNISVPISKDQFKSAYGQKGGVCDKGRQFLDAMNAVTKVESECELPVPCEPTTGAIECKGGRIGFDSIGRVVYYQVTISVNKDNEYLSQFETLYGRNNRELKKVPKGIVVTNSASDDGVGVSWTGIYLPNDNSQYWTILLIYALKNENN